jgi:hypothetical protein
MKQPSEIEAGLQTLRRLTSLGRVLLLLVVAGTACRSRDARDEARSDTQPPPSRRVDTVVAITRDSVAALDRGMDSVADRATERRLDSITPFIDALEDSVANFPTHARRSAWLWQLGELWSRNLSGHVCPSGGKPPALGLRYQQYFDADCCSCETHYNYTHWKTLVAEFPNDPRAPDAMYGLTNAEWTGECEGDVSCWINSEFAALNEFLRRYPNSAHTGPAVDRANEAFTSALAFRPEKGELFELNDADVIALIARYDSTAERLAPPLRARAYRVIGPLWTMFGNDARAAELYRLAVSEGGERDDTAGLGRTWDSLVAKLKAPRPPPPPPYPVYYIDLQVGGVGLRESSEDVRQRFGEPDSILLEPHPRYPDGRRKLVTWFYRARHRMIVDYQSGDRLQTVTTTDPALPTSRGIRVGDVSDSVKARYGGPEQISGKYWIYPAHDHPNGILRFTIRNGRVAEILAGSVGPRGQ